MTMTITLSNENFKTHVNKLLLAYFPGQNWTRRWHQSPKLLVHLQAAHCVKWITIKDLHWLISWHMYANVRVPGGYDNVVWWKPLGLFSCFYHIRRRRHFKHMVKRASRTTRTLREDQDMHQMKTPTCSLLSLYCDCSRFLFSIQVVSLGFLFPLWLLWGSSQYFTCLTATSDC